MNEDETTSTAHAVADSPVAADCPTPIAHARLREAHTHWHSALAGYQNPESFRVALNACLQSLRNVTFGLQKDKRLIPAFADWYEPWRDRMKADHLMKWVVEARNKVVKADDLQTYSTAKIRFVGDYFAAADEVSDSLMRANRFEPAGGKSRAKPDSADEDDLGTDGPEIEASSPLLTVGEIAHEFYSNTSIPRRRREQTSISIERSWVDRELPDIELLDALAHCYGFLSLMIDDAHSVVSRQTGVAVEREASRVDLTVVQSHQGRLPCMVTSRATRTVVFGPDGSAAGGMTFNLSTQDLDVAKAEKSLKRYRVKPARLDKLPMSPIDRMPIFESNARSILKSGEEHGWFVLYYKGRHQVHQQNLAARDKADKRILAQEVAELVARNEIDGVVVIGEVWRGVWQEDDEGFPIPPAEQTDRDEAVVIHAEVASGESKTVTIPFRRRRFGSPVIEDSVDDVEHQYFFLEPTRAVWTLMGLRQDESDESDAKGENHAADS